MNSKIANVVLFGFAASLVFACGTKNDESPMAAVVNKDSVKNEIQAKENEFASTYNSGDIKDIGYYADDANSYYQNRAPLVGKPAIVNFLKADIVANTNKISFTTNEVFVSNDANQVVELGYFKVVDSVNSIINSGNYMSLFEKRNGKYVSVRDMSASDQPDK